MPVYMQRLSPIIIKGQWMRIAPEDQNVIAIDGHHRFFKTMKMAAMQTCQKFGDTHMCPWDNVVRRVPKEIPHEKDFCMLSLVMEDYSSITRTCQIAKIEQQEQIQQVGPNLYHIANPKLHKFRIHCPGQQHLRFTHRKLMVTIQLQDGCMVTTNS